MLISCSVSERGSDSSSPGVIIQRDDGRETSMKVNDGSGWSSNGVMLLLGRMQNRDAVEWCGEWVRLICSFYTSGGWELNSPVRVACDSGADSML
jgi:hypothetical protein